MQISSWTIDIGTIVLSGLVSLLVARHTVNKRVGEERKRDVEQWYIDAGVQAELGKNDWANEILSEGTTADSSEQTLRQRASRLEEHSAKGEFLDADDTTVAALEQMAANYRYAALLLEKSGSVGAELKEIEDEMWVQVETVQENVSNHVNYRFGD